MIVIGARVGGKIKSEHVGDGGWYFKWFTNYGNADFCSALQGGLSGPHAQIPRSGVQPRFKKCPEADEDKGPTNKIHLGFVREAEVVDGQPHFHMMNYKAGDKWTGHYFNAQGSFKSRDIDNYEKKLTDIYGAAGSLKGRDTSDKREIRGNEVVEVVEKKEVVEEA